MMKRVLGFLYSWYFRTFIFSLNACYLAIMTYTSSSLIGKIIPGILSLGMMYNAVSFYKEGKKICEVGI